ncbi:MAG: hypothetical protein RLZZ595_157 [Bacteroidota bacterium]
MQIQLKEISVVLNNKKLLDNISFAVEENEQWAITGASGAGKTTLAHALANKIFYHGEIKFTSDQNESPSIALIEQHHKFKNKQNIDQFYHQQRFNSADAEDTFTVAEVLQENKAEEIQKWTSHFGIQNLLHKPMIQLSNGENKRLQLTKAMLQNPTLVILDNPFVGLDKEGRKILQEALNKIAAIGKKIILICSPKDIPECITHIALLQSGKLEDAGKKKEMLDKYDSPIASNAMFTVEGVHEIYQPQNAIFNTAIRMLQVNIQYNHTPILKNIHWEVKRGEKWCLSGPNGSGKSTLLSLITADNPQAFANNIWLFDKKKGTGESIWEIKQKIGHVSPELHLCFDKGSLVEDVVASGLYDTMGLFRKPSASDLEKVNSWMSFLGIDKYKGKRLFTLSLGEQREVMLTRALVKSPLLLILDEPCQGLDEQQSSKFKHTIDAICSLEDVTLIYVSHYQEDIPPRIKNFISLKHGEIISD